MKKITLLFLALFSIISAYAVTKDDGFLTITSSITVEAGGSVKIPVSLTNKIDIYGVQCDIYLSSADITLKVNNKGKYVFGTNADRVDGQTESSKLQSDGAIRYMLADYTADNPFYENEGELFYINVNIGEGASGEYTVTLKGITLATDEGKILNDDIVCTLTIPGGNDAEKEANSFKTDFASILGKTTSTVTSSDIDDIKAAIDAYNQLSDAAKAKLSEEKALLDALKTKAEELKAAEEADAAATAEANKFKTDNANILGKTTETVASSDIPAIDKALEDYSKLSDAALAKLTNGEKALLDALKTKAEELKAAEEADAAATAEANKFKTDNANILGKNIDDITADDKDAVNKALEDYDKLSDAAKDKLTEEKADLDSKKVKIDAIITGISSINVSTSVDKYYNLNGQRTSSSTKGIIIKNGKKIFVK